MMTLGDVSTPCKRWLLRPIPPPILWLHSPCRLHKGRHQSHVMAPSRFARLQLASRRGPIKPRSSLSAHSSHWPHVGRCKPHNPALPHMAILAVRDLLLIIQTSQSSLRCLPSRERTMIVAWASALPIFIQRYEAPHKHIYLV